MSKLLLKLQKNMLYITLFLLSFVIIVFFSLKKLNSSTKYQSPAEKCVSGYFDSTSVEEFLNVDNSYDFHTEVNTALQMIRTEGNDYKLRGVSFSAGSLAHAKPYFYFVSIEKQKVVTTDGLNILYSENEPFASNKGIVPDNVIDTLISPSEAVRIAKPILNCYSDYPQKLRKDVSLNVDNSTNKIRWIVTVEDFMKSVPGPNISHSVIMDANTGEALEYK